MGVARSLKAGSQEAVRLSSRQLVVRRDRQGVVQT